MPTSTHTQALIWLEQTMQVARAHFWYMWNMAGSLESQCSAIDSAPQPRASCRACRVQASVRLLDRVG